MDNPNPEQLFGTTNELAKERNRAAAERTLNTWIGNSLTLTGLGVAFDQINAALSARFPDAGYISVEEITHVVGLSFVAAAMLLLVFALVQHRLEIKTIEREDYILLSVTTLNRFVVVSVLIMGLACLLSLLLLM